MINFVIPMAGRGKRFAEAGFIDPKPFIDVAGVPMIIRVVQNLVVSDEHRFIFICLKDFVDKYGIKFRKMLGGINHKIITIESVTEGAACTVLLAKHLINNEDELVIANSDQIVLDHNYSQESIDFYRKKNADGGILCFLNNSPKWSYIRLNGENVSTVVEKQVISDLATVGIYYYRSGKIFVDAAEHMVSNNIRVNNEFYVAPTYNSMIVRNMKVVPFLVNEMVGLGIPEDLQLALDRRIF